MKAFRAQDAVEVGFPGARTIIRTYREVWQTRKIGKKDKHGRDVRKCVGKPTTEKAACNDIARGDGWRPAASA